MERLLTASNSMPLDQHGSRITNPSPRRTRKSRTLRSLQCRLTLLTLPLSAPARNVPLSSNNSISSLTKSFLLTFGAAKHRCSQLWGATIYFGYPLTAHSSPPQQLIFHHKMICILCDVLLKRRGSIRNPPSPIIIASSNHISRFFVFLIIPIKYFD